MNDKCLTIKLAFLIQITFNTTTSLMPSSPANLAEDGTTVYNSKTKLVFILTFTINLFTPIFLSKFLVPFSGPSLTQ